MTKSSKAKTGILRQRTAFEWAILVVSSAAIATIVVGLVFYSSQFEGRPPKLVISIEPAQDEQNEFVLRVENRGGTTAEDVVVEVSRGDETQLVEFRAVPKAAEEEATVKLEGAGEPTARVVAFKGS